VYKNRPVDFCTHILKPADAIDPCDRNVVIIREQVHVFRIASQCHSTNMRPLVSRPYYCDWSTLVRLTPTQVDSSFNVNLTPENVIFGTYINLFEVVKTKEPE
jgi:hypothetical protein